VFSGGAGIAFALCRLATLRDEPVLVDLADQWIQRTLVNSTGERAFIDAQSGARPELIGHVSPYHTLSGLDCVEAAIAHARPDHARQQEAMERYLAHVAGPCANPDLTLGRAGVLMGCVLLLALAPRESWPATSALISFGDELMHSIWRGNGRRAGTYLGMAHGSAGIAYATLQWCRLRSVPVPDPVQQSLAELRERAEPIGRGCRWPIRRDGRATYMPGWCNGAAGYVFLWTLAESVLGDNGYLPLAERAALNVIDFPSGLNTLCCGTAGQAYALLALYRRSGEHRWLDAAAKLGVVSARGCSFSGPRWHSLYWGELASLLIIEDLARPERSLMPFFEPAR
jgi:serine/threonine-protein kinase